MTSSVIWRARKMKHVHLEIHRETMDDDCAIVVGERGRWLCTRGRTVHLLFFYFFFSFSFSFLRFCVATLPFPGFWICVPAHCGPRSTEYVPRSCISHRHCAARLNQIGVVQIVCGSLGFFFFSCLVGLAPGSPLRGLVSVGAFSGVFR